MVIKLETPTLNIYDQVFIDKNILVTGGTGSFGDKFVEAILKTKVKSTNI